MGANGLQPILNAIMSIFSFIGCRCLRLSPLTCCVSCSPPCLFAHVLCNSPYGLKQTQNMSGSVLLATEASQLSVGIAGKQHSINIEDTLIIVKKDQKIDKFT